jgi:Carboxypeptidase regulatory-like domain
MSFRTSIIAAGLLAGFGACVPQARAGGLSVFSGEVLGEVRNSTGALQMGAAVSLYNRYDQLIRQVLTNESGKFAFDGVAPDTYSIHVNLASFLPAVRNNIIVAPGSENLLHVNLGTLFSGVDIAPPSAVPGALMSDEWKWVLRTSAATRPVLRFAPVFGTPSGTGTSSSGSHRHLIATFTETTGLVKLSAGDSGPAAGGSAQDLGTAFAVATRMNGDSTVRFSGNFSYLANSGLPIAAFRTTYARDEDGQAGPQISLTVHQISFPGLGPADGTGAAFLPAPGDSAPALRTVTFGVADKLQVNDDILLEYGAHLDSVSFIQSQARMTPFARLTYSLSPEATLRLAYSSGTMPSELLNRDSSLRSGETGNQELNQDLAALAMLPAITRDNNQIHMQRARNFEAAYQFARGDRKYYLTVYNQAVSDAAFDMSSPPIFQTRTDLLPALDGNYYVFDIGAYQQTGISGAISQALGSHAEFTVSAGTSGDLASNPTRLAGNSPEDVRAEVRAVQGYFAIARGSAVVPGIGMRIAASYGWTSAGMMMPTHYSLTGPIDQQQGLNIAVHQPLPRFIGFKGRLEATGELRNALADGYLPVTAAGHCAVLTDAPRTLRGGLSFLF